MTAAPMVGSRHRLRIVAVMLVLTVAALTSCSHVTPDPTAAQHTAADIAFARNMIPHHQQAVVLAAMVPARTGNADLRVTATHIGAD